MSDYANGLSCVIKAGTYGSETDIIGQGTMAEESVGAPIEVDNKSSGEWTVVVDGTSTTRAKNFTVTFDYNDDPSMKALIDACDAFTVGPYVVDCRDYYFDGNFLPSITSTTRDKSALVQYTILFKSNGPVLRTWKP